MGTFWNSLSIVAVACILILQLMEVRGQEYFLNSLCGISYPLKSNFKVVNGKDAIIGSAPFMAYLIHNNTLYCGGTIINQRYILTAAHCVRNDLIVRLGEYNTNTNPDCVAMNCFPRHEDFSIKVFTYHKDFRNMQGFNDIGLIKLNRNINFNVHIMPICLLLNPINVPYRRQWKAFGWGQTQRGPSSSVLQTTMLNHYPNSHCAQKLNTRLGNNQVCLGSQASDTCSGDSGGPLVTHINIDGVDRYLQVGVVSFGSVVCQSPGVYTYVPHYIGWIRSVIKRLG